MPDLRATFSPIGWIAISAGVWLKDLPTVEGGDTFSLLRFSPGARLEVAGDGENRALLIDGTLEGTRTHHRGDWFPLAGHVTSPGGALLVWLDGARLGPPADDTFGPAGWASGGPGLWFRLLLEMPADRAFDERVLGLTYLEPGAASARHPHPTAHRFLFLDGEADDEIVHPDGRRELADRRVGDFVDYPSGVSHQTFSRRGCLLLFVHEPLAEKSSPEP